MDGSWSWRTASASDTSGHQCVEVAWTGEAVLIRDSDDRGGPVLCFSPAAWRDFLTSPLLTDAPGDVR